MAIVGIHVMFEQISALYASCDMSNYLSNFFCRENFRKCKTCRKIQTTWHGPLNWSYNSMSRIGAILTMLRNNVLSNGAFLAYAGTSVEHGLFLVILEMASTFARRWTCPWSELKQSLNEFRHCLHVATRLSIYGSFFTRKTLEMQNLSKSQITSHVALNWSYNAMEKIGAISMMLANNMLLDRVFWPNQTLSIQHGIF